ncbi:SnoaL-like domain-containing protein [Actinokineospora alba]|uniref:SnoaL-like domain-containing protein n=1 Tax=Actinokineospora alba TaxID=504798 RepID=A0A1H0QUT0_9PSEU|nr:nuclear transport factor 2 family protein [Actinokineospora alba]TDP70390.1 SnoaL-like protein [Actinokineospora alba]SDI32733.1 SnoaL-like domain-containing protein [Actinokineospora alba]SDP20895.1 SnoaL-like domain-containing protein [Actinokineospora alba]
MDDPEFLKWVNTRLRAAEIAVHDGDADPRREIWSRREPVSILGAAWVAVGRAEVDATFDWLAERFSGAQSYEFELLAADVVGDLAYTVGYEHIECLTNGELSKYTLRATQIYRREDGEWKVVHRHGDALDTPRQAT